MLHFFKEIARAFVFGLGVFVVLLVVSYLMGGRIESMRELLEELGINQLYSIVLYTVNSYVIRHYVKVFGRDFFKTKNVLQSVTSILLVTVVCLILIRLFLQTVIYDQPISVFTANEKLGYYVVGFIITVVVLIVFYSFYYYKSTKEQQVKEQKKIARSATASFDALKNQLDPHFLFNSLNVLTSLIEENPQAATKFTTALSKVYRYVLEQKNKDLVTQQEELNFARLYMSLLKMRFEDSIVFNMPEQLKNPEAKVVPLSLQLLLENAVKHNQVTSSRKLHITIKETADSLVVTNNIQPKQVVKKSSGVGLQNIRKRYHLLTDRPVNITKDTQNFMVSIPLLTRQTSTMNTQEEFIQEKRYIRAQERVEKLKGFYVHFGIYLIFVPIFIYLNAISTSFPWALFPIIGWGLGVLGHAMEAFNYNPFLGRNWEERKIREFMDKEDF